MRNVKSVSSRHVDRNAPQPAEPGLETWGALKVSAFGLDGAPALVSKGKGGLGVQAGRSNNWIDHDPVTGASEVLRLDFAAPVDSATLRVAGLNPNENGRAEMGAWKAYDSSGQLIGEGLLDPRAKTPVASRTYDFTIDLPADIARIEISALPYDNEAGSVDRQNSSDFQLAKVTYVPASPRAEPPPPSPPPGAVLVESDGSTVVTEGGATDSFKVALTARPASNVMITVTGTADVDVSHAGGAAPAITLTFTPDNWDAPQTVNVHAVDDTLVEGPETTSLALSTAGDPAYAGLAPVSVAVLVRDNDMPPPSPPPTSTPAGPPPGSIIVRPDDDIQALVNAQGEGAVFWITAGVHRLEEIVPKNGQQFIGEDGAILSGARELNNFVKVGNAWYVDGQTQQGWARFTDMGLSGFDRAGHPDAVYFNDKPMLQVATLQEVCPDSYYFDYAADRIYIGNDPSGQLVEAAVASFAFEGGATGVTVRNLIVEKYASPVQIGAIGGYRQPVDWLIEGNEVRLNYGVGIKVGERSRVIGNLVHNNGQLGVGANGAGVLFADNEITANGFWSGINTGWEGGGSKFAHTVDLVVRGNFVHDNNGHGLWTDIDNFGTLYEGNRVENNLGAGIVHEISYEAVIRDNAVVGNGAGYHVWLWGAGILIQNSSDVQVHGNTVDMTGGGHGIALVQQDRGAGAHGPWVTTGNSVHDNVIINRAPGHGKSGAVADHDFEGMIRGGNMFDRNEYRLADPEGAHFAYNAPYDWNTYRSVSGWDLNSTTRLIPRSDPAILRGTAP